MATKKQQAEYRKSQAKSKLAWGIAFFFCYCVAGDSPGPLPVHDFELFPQAV